MTLTAFVLILVSALLHVGWNLIGKRIAQSILFYAWSMAAGGLLFSPFLLLNGTRLLKLPNDFWLLLIGSGLCQALYLIGLARAYMGANLSLVYPLARALPVLIVPLLVLMVYGESLLSGRDLLGMLLILTGAIALPLNKWRRWQLSDYLCPSIGWILLAACATAGYSVIDSLAVRLMAGQGFTAFQAGSSFVVLQAVSTVLWMLVLLKLVFRERLTDLPDKRWSVIAGGFVIGTYMLVLISMSLVAEVSYVVALRQVSIPLGVIIGVLLLGERLSFPGLQGLLAMLVGLILVSLA